MKEHLVRQILRHARSTVMVLNAYHVYYHYDRKTAKWARREENCKTLLGSVPRPILIEILERIKS